MAYFVGNGATEMHWAARRATVSVAMYGAGIGIAKTGTGFSSIYI